MALERKTETERLQEDFPFEGNLAGKVHTWEDLEVFDESSVCHTLMDFSGVDQIHVWANAAYLHMTEKTMEDFCSLRLSDSSASLRKLIAHYHQQIQVLKHTARYVHTTYPKRGPMRFYLVQRPFLLQEQNGEVKTLIFSDLIPAREDKEEGARPLEELSRFTNVAQLIIDSQTLEVVAGNPIAQFDYQCGKDFRLLAGGTKLTLADLFESCSWEGEEHRKEAWEQVRALTLSSEPLEIEVQKKKQRAVAEAGDRLSIDVEIAAGEDALISRSWYKLVFFPAVNPATGRDSLMLSQYDITELKKTQEELTAMNETRDLTFASISHELRTPLNGIVGLTDALLQAPGCPAQVKKSLDVIRSQGLRLTGLVNDILDAASTKRGKLVLNMGAVDLFQVTESVCDLLRPLLRKSVKLVNDIAPGALPLLEGDPNRITQVLVNLVSNAIKFTEKGSITVQARLEGTSGVVLEVADTGIGIPEHKIGRVWGAFEQESSKTTKKYGGTGLGLALVRSLVEAHGGSCEVTSRFRQVPSGTTFWVSLPLKGNDGRNTPSSSGSGEDAALWLAERRPSADSFVAEEAPWTEAPEGAGAEDGAEAAGAGGEEAGLAEQNKQLQAEVQRLEEALADMRRRLPLHRSPRPAPHTPLHPPTPDPRPPPPPPPRPSDLAPSPPPEHAAAGGPSTLPSTPPSPALASAHPPASPHAPDHPPSRQRRSDRWGTEAGGGSGGQGEGAGGGRTGEVERTLLLRMVQLEALAREAAERRERLSFSYRIRSQERWNQVLCRIGGHSVGDGSGQGGLELRPAMAAGHQAGVHARR